MKKTDLLIVILVLVGVLMIGLGFGYMWGTQKINKCKAMTPDAAFKDEDCREFYLGG